jgi:hypothetical protein
MLDPLYRLGSGEARGAEDNAENEENGNAILFHGYLLAEGYPI